VTFSTGYSGFCGLVHLGPTYLIATRRTKLVIDDSKQWVKSGILKGIFEALPPESRR